jgi:hypothetical protein
MKAATIHINGIGTFESSPDLTIAGVIEHSDIDEATKEWLERSLQEILTHGIPKETARSHERDLSLGPALL